MEARKVRLHYAFHKFYERMHGNESFAGTRVPSESGETESESESDSEPRMTLSERFSKLSQLSTDKRELAKPLLSPNEMDTKMKVIKDFRNPEAPKVLVASDTNANAPLNNR